MKVRVDCEKLREAMNFVTSVIESKFTYPILLNVLFEVDDQGKVRLRATDHDMTLVADLTAEEVIEPGAITIPGKKCQSVISAVQGGASALIATTGEGVELNIGRSVFKLATMPANEFPEEPIISDEMRMNMPSKTFVHMLRAVSTSMALTDPRQQLNASLLELSSSYVRTVATDGMLMGVCTNHEISLDGDSTVEAIIPRKSVLELIRAFASDSGNLELRIGPKVLTVEGEERSLSTNLIDSKYYAYQNIIPREGGNILQCDRDTLLRAVHQAATLSDLQQKVFFNAENERLKITATTEAGDRAEVEIPIVFGNGSTDIILRHDRLHDVLTAFNSDTISFHIPEQQGPIRVDSSDEKDLIFVVSPIRG